MPRKCVVPGCDIRSSDREHDPSLKLHSIPKNEQLRKKWIDFCCRPEVANLKRGLYFTLIDQEIQFNNFKFCYTLGRGLLRLLTQIKCFPGTLVSDGMLTL